MSKLALCFLVVTLCSAEAGAECKAPADDAKVSIPGRRNLKLRELAAWMASMSCRSIGVADGLGDRPVVLFSPPTLTFDQARRAFFAAVDLMGLAVEPASGGLRIVRHEEARGRLSGFPAVDSCASSAVAALRPLGEHHLEVKRDYLLCLLGQPAMLVRTARIVPAVKDGRPQGFRIFAIRPGSVLALLGMKNGDTVAALNGIALDTPERALEAYSKVRNATHLTLDLVRAGAPLTLRYTIR